MVSMVTNPSQVLSQLVPGGFGGGACVAPLGEDAGGWRLASTPCAFSLCCFWFCALLCNKSEPRGGQYAESCEPS